MAKKNVLEFLSLFFLSDFKWSSESCEIKFHECYFCVCQACKLDFVFFVDLSADSEPQCGKNMVDKFGDLDELLGITLDNFSITYNGAKSQIDFVLDFIQSKAF